jgi:hypothetical protein
MDGIILSLELLAKIIPKLLFNFIPVAEFL